jgi:hypothetical protein
VRPDEPTQLPLDGLSLNFCVSIFRKSVEKSQVFLRMVRITGISRKKQYTFMIIYCSVLPKIKNISDKNFRENRNTFHVQ